MRVVWVALLMLGAGAGATTWVSFPWPELSEPQAAQLATAVDGDRPDEPALYPLLLHTRAWSGEDVQHVVDFHREHMEAGGGWLKVLDAPAGFRGELFLLEGRFAGRVREVELLRGGPWGETVTEWGLVADGPKDAPGRVAIVYFPCAPEKLARPRDRQRVRLAGRFFKTWTDVDAAGVQTTYPVFVAAPFWEPVVVGGGVPWRGMVLVVAGLVGVLWWVRRRGAGRKGKRGIRKGGTRRLLGRGGGEATEADPGLPDDPAEALDVLAQRSGEPLER